MQPLDNGHQQDQFSGASASQQPSNHLSLLDVATLQGWITGAILSYVEDELHDLDPAPESEDSDPLRLAQLLGPLVKDAAFFAVQLGFGSDNPPGVSTTADTARFAPGSPHRGWTASDGGDRNGFAAYSGEAPHTPNGPGPSTPQGAAAAYAAVQVTLGVSPLAGLAAADDIMHHLSLQPHVTGVDPLDFRDGRLTVLLTSAHRDVAALAEALRSDLAHLSPTVESAERNAIEIVASAGPQRGTPPAGAAAWDSVPQADPTPALWRPDILTTPAWGASTAAEQQDGASLRPVAEAASFDASADATVILFPSAFNGATAQPPVAAPVPPPAPVYDAEDTGVPTFYEVFGVPAPLEAQQPLRVVQPESEPSAPEAPAAEIAWPEPDQQAAVFEQETAWADAAPPAPADDEPEQETPSAAFLTGWLGSSKSAPDLLAGSVFTDVPAAPRLLRADQALAAWGWPSAETDVAAPETAPSEWSYLPRGASREAPPPAPVEVTPPAWSRLGAFASDDAPVWSANEDDRRFGSPAAAASVPELTVEQTNADIWAEFRALGLEGWTPQAPVAATWEPTSWATNPSWESPPETEDTANAEADEAAVWDATPRPAAPEWPAATVGRFDSEAAWQTSPVADPAPQWTSQADEGEQAWRTADAEASWETRWGVPDAALPAELAAYAESNAADVTEDDPDRYSQSISLSDETVTQAFGMPLRSVSGGAALVPTPPPSEFAAQQPIEAQPLDSEVSPETLEVMNEWLGANPEEVRNASYEQVLSWMHAIATAPIEPAAPGLAPTPEPVRKAVPVEPNWADWEEDEPEPTFLTGRPWPPAVVSDTVPVGRTPAAPDWAAEPQAFDPEPEAEPAPAFEPMVRPAASLGEADEMDGPRPRRAVGLGDEQLDPNL
ncbi:MAG: hypothetical protein NTZ05_21955, partial [Chloroflexi bacterium]|nr:hypothetical protein [Chloroflexota bacterium]